MTIRTMAFLITVLDECTNKMIMKSICSNNVLDEEKIQLIEIARKELNEEIRKCK